MRLVCFRPMGEYVFLGITVINGLWLLCWGKLASIDAYTQDWRFNSLLPQGLLIRDTTLGVYNCSWPSHCSKCYFDHSTWLLHPILVGHSLQENTMGTCLMKLITLSIFLHHHRRIQKISLPGTIYSSTVGALYLSDTWPTESQFRLFKINVNFVS